MSLFPISDPLPGEMFNAQTADLRSNMKAKYVVGFLIAPITGRVLLQRKARPGWMAGKYNGHGGKREPGEGALSAMSRETQKELGIHLDRTAWVRFHDETFSSGATIAFMTAEVPEEVMNQVVVMTRESSEPCKDFLINHVINGMHGTGEQCLYNIPYLVSMGVTLHYAHPSNRPTQS